MDWDSKPANSAAYWVAYVLNAFQEREEFDRDPDNQPMQALARSDLHEGGALLYLEQINEDARRTQRDRTAVEQEVVVHEIGHLVGNSGAESVTRTPAEPHRYTEHYLKLIRSSAKPAG